jgi:death-on-curing protein
MAARQEPKWLARSVVGAIHDAQLTSDGGLQGLRDPGALESALGRPMHRWQYDEATDVADCAASYGFGLAKNHAFADGNKRTAFVVMATFHELNGGTLAASEEEMVEVMVGVADGSISEKQLAAWLRANSAKPRRKRKESGSRP